MRLENGYEFISTFWTDFSIADRYGEEAIRDTYKRAFKEWQNNIVYLTELSATLNLKIWQHWEMKDSLDTLYDELWREIDNWILDNKTEEEIDHYLKVTD